MKCPNCSEEISFVVVYSTASQKGLLNDSGTEIVDYVDIEIHDIKRVVCPECDVNLEVGE